MTKAKIIREEPYIVVQYTREFLYKESLGRSGFTFPCDKDGHILDEQMTEEAWANYGQCMAHPERFQEFNVLAQDSRIIQPDPELVCKCGHRFSLSGDGYYMAWQCPECGQWYNMSGDELVPPSEWQEPLEEDY